MQTITLPTGWKFGNCILWYEKPGNKLELSTYIKFHYFGVFVEKVIGQEQCGNLFWPCHSILRGLLTCLIRIQIIKTCINFLYLNTIRKADIFVKYWRFIEPNCVWSDLKRGAYPHTFLYIIFFIFYRSQSIFLKYLFEFSNTFYHRVVQIPRRNDPPKNCENIFFWLF